MDFHIGIHGVALRHVDGGIAVGVGNNQVVLNNEAFAQLCKAMQFIQTIGGTTPSTEQALLTPDAAPVARASAATVINVPAAQSAPPVVAAARLDADAATETPTASAYPGPTKRGPRQAAARAGSMGDSQRRAVPTPATTNGLRSPNPTADLTQRGGQRQRGALVRLMVEWFAANPGPRSLDEVVSAAEMGSWTQAQSVRPAVIAALRRVRKQVQRNGDGTFNLTPTSTHKPARFVRRPRQR